MLLRDEKSASKRGKQKSNTMHGATRLEGKVKNVGIKNVGHQKKKPASK